MQPPALEQRRRSAFASLRSAFESRVSLRTYPPCARLSCRTCRLLTFPFFNDSKSDSSNSGGNSNLSSSLSSQPPFVASQSPLQLGRHMQGPEPDFTYFDDVVPSKRSLYCQPLPPYNGRICFLLSSLVFTPPSKMRKSAVLFLHSSLLLDRTAQFLRPVRPPLLARNQFCCCSHHFLLY